MEKKKNVPEAVLNALRGILQGYPSVVAAYLYGSFADGYRREGSDIDVGVLLDAGLGKIEAFALELELGDELERKLKRKVDLLVLNRAPLSLCFRVLRGILVMEREPTKRALFESRVLSRYYDNKRFLRFHLRELHKRALEGEFGTPG